MTRKFSVTLKKHILYFDRYWARAFHAP